MRAGAGPGSGGWGAHGGSGSTSGCLSYSWIPSPKAPKTNAQDTDRPTQRAPRPGSCQHLSSCQSPEDSARATVEARCHAVCLCSELSPRDWQASGHGVDVPSP